MLYHIIKTGDSPFEGEEEDEDKILKAQISKFMFFIMKKIF